MKQFNKDNNTDNNNNNKQNAVTVGNNIAHKFPYIVSTVLFIDSCEELILKTHRDIYP